MEKKDLSKLVEKESEGEEDEPKVQVIIDRLTKKGYGAGKTEKGSTLYEIPATIPGEKVNSIPLKRKKRGYKQAKLSSILIPSPLRVSPSCFHFGSCGGCQWQHMSYEEQIKQKEKKLDALFPILQKEAIIGSEFPWHYRNKMEFTFSEDSKQNRYLGLIQQNSRGKVVSLRECALSPSWFLDILKTINIWWEKSGFSAYHPHRNQGHLRNLTLREGKRTKDKLVMLTITAESFSLWTKEKIDFFVESITTTIQEENLSIFLRIHDSQAGKKTEFKEILLFGNAYFKETLFLEIQDCDPFSLDLRIGPTSFFQPNTLQAEKIYATALSMVKIEEKTVVYDLYCGIGGFALASGKFSKHVLGIEICLESIQNAKENARINHLSSVSFWQGDVKNLIKKIKEEKLFPLPDLVVVDPPRTGLGKETIQQLIELFPKKIIYVSCNPLTQKEDLILLEKCGYQMMKRQAIDSFAHTVHVENIILLEKVGP